jgi:hypothetical protein
MARKTIIVCDVCESAAQVRPWEIKAKDTGAKKTVELCITHSAPLARLLGGTEEETPAETPAPASRRGRQRGPTTPPPQ